MKKNFFDEYFLLIWTSFISIAIIVAFIMVIMYPTPPENIIVKLEDGRIGHHCTLLPARYSTGGVICDEFDVRETPFEVISK